MRGPSRAVTGAVVVLVLTGACSAGGPEAEQGPVATVPGARPGPTPPATDSPPPGPATVAGPDLPAATATPVEVLTGLRAPWGLAFLPGGAVLVTLRDTGQVVLLTAGGASALTGPGAEALASTTRFGGEGGLLGVAVSADVATDGLVHLYRTTDGGNEVVRAVLDAGAGTLGALEPVLTGIPAAGNHNGGRLAFGPDGFLYVATGDAGDRPAAQDLDSLAGKILRVTGDGAAAPGNPFAGSRVWTFGHRNVQGLGWDPEGRLIASELGQDTFDELNLIEAGGDYGWPQVEGHAGVDGLTDPLVTWDPDEASPSGLAVTGDGVYVAALRGQRLWSVPWDGGRAGEPSSVLDGLGRLRDVVLGPDGALWVLTQNTDGRGSPRDGDDRLLRLLPP